eukprot:180606-Pyramimonas_sp.AAC.1
MRPRGGEVRGRGAGGGKAEIDMSTTLLEHGKWSRAGAGSEPVLLREVSLYPQPRLGLSPRPS